MGFFIVEKKFLTEKETESLLETETRNLPMPDGTTQPFAGFKFMWRSYDFIIESGLYTGKRLTELAVINGEETGCAFDISLRNVLAYIHQALRKAQGTG